MAGGRPVGKGEWCPELAALEDEPYLMLLAAVVLRAMWDSGSCREAKRFGEKVRANAAAGLGRRVRADGDAGDRA